MFRWCWGLLALACGVAASEWPAKLGEPAPDVALRDRAGTEVRLSDYRHKKQVVLLAGRGPMATAAIEDTVVLFLAGADPATILVDSSGIIRRVHSGQALTGAALADFVESWQWGRTVYTSACARCHGEEGDNNICLDVKPLIGIGRRLSEAQIRERLRPGEINDRELLVRGQIFSRQDVKAVIAYVAGL